MAVSFLECQYVMSKPTGFTNKALPSKYNKSAKIDKNKLKINLQQNKNNAFPTVSNNLNKSAAAMLAERESQMQGAEDGYGTAGTPLRVKNRQGFRSDLEDVKHVSDEENEEDGYIPDEDPQDIQQSSGQPNFEATKENHVPEGGNLGEEKWDGDELKVCSDLVYRLMVTNISENPVMFKLSLEKKEGEILNLRLPVNGLKGKLAPGQQTTLALLPKIVPTAGAIFANYKSEIEKLDLSLNVKLEEPNVPRAQPVEPPAPDVPSSPALPTSSSEKNCGACTMLNPISATICSVCSTAFM